MEDKTLEIMLRDQIRFMTKAGCISAVCLGSDYTELQMKSGRKIRYRSNESMQN